jgi:hypothetical protein
VSHHDLRSRGPGDAATTAPPVLSIDISRELATVVVTLEGFLDEDSSPALVALLWDLVVGQGNLSVSVDARRLTLSDPALIWVFQVLDREAAIRGGTLAVVEPTPPPFASADPNRTAAALDHRRARRIAALGRAAHPAGGARTTQTE